MKLRRLIILNSLILMLFLSTLPTFSQTIPSLLTIAESSNYTATSRYTDVLEFIEALQQSSPYLRVETICTSTEGRDIPLLVIGNPVPASPQDLRYDDRGVMYIQANIHAGEVEGKEASLMLVRDILKDESLPFLDNLVLLVAPIFNADGNEKISTQNRTTQNGPSDGVGVRHNGMYLDLNRDAIKLESPEVRGLVKNVLNKWDPFLLIDCHTTNGSYHEEPVTYTWAFNPNGDNGIIDYMRNSFIPFIKKNMKDKFDVLSIPYGNFMDYKDPEKGWRTAGPQCRYITNYIGLRNRLSILNENYTYADFKTRVQGCYAFLHSVLEFCDAQKDEILTMVRDVDQKTISRGLAPSEADSFAVEYDLQAYDEKITILGYEMEVIPREGSWPRVKKTDVKRTYHVPYYCKYVPTRYVGFPCGYFIEASAKNVVKNLLKHGITVEKLDEPVEVKVESFTISEIESDERAYQGHHLNSVKCESTSEVRKFPEGTFYVSTAQRLGTLAAYLLEPESDDGLLVWNFFDQVIIPQWGRYYQGYPVHKAFFIPEIVKTTVQN